MTYYASAEDFATLYPDESAGTFERYAFDAQRAIDDATMTIDGTKKLRVAFPTDEEDAETVRRCMCAVVFQLSKIDEARAAATAAGTYVATESGYHAGTIRSISAGGESITFGDDSGTESDIAAAAKSQSAAKQYIAGIIRGYFAGTRDGNGVNLLYGGFYPGRRQCLGEQ